MLEQEDYKILNELLKIFSDDYSRKEYLDLLVETIREWLDCQYVGIRILDKQGYIPYESYLGFSKKFWESENWLSINHDQCACIRIINENPEEQDLPLMTKGGSFWSNQLIDCAKQFTDEELKVFRGKCIGYGFHSMAVIPIKFNQKMFGALHIADEHRDRFTEHKIAFLETIAHFIGEVLNRYAIEEELQENYNAKAVIKGLLDNTRTLAYVTDQETYELLYVSPAIEKYFKTSLIGKTCYQEFFNYNEPCEFCRCPDLSNIEKAIGPYEIYIDQDKKNYIKNHKLVDWSDGREVNFVYAIDITDWKSLQQKFHEKLHTEKVVGRISSKLFAGNDFNDALEFAIKDIGKLLCANQVSLCLDKQEIKNYGCIEARIKQGVYHSTKTLESLLFSLKELLNSGKIIKKMNKSKEITPENVSSYVAIPLKVDDQLLGAILVIDIDWDKIDYHEILGALKLSSEIIGNFIYRKKIQDSLTLSEKQYRTIFESSGCAMAIVDEDMILSLVNNKLENLFGYHAEEVVGKKKFTDFLFLDQIERIKVFHTQRRINPETVPMNYDTTILDNYGKVRHVNLTVDLLPGTKKSVVSLLDITERKEAEERLKYLSFHDSLTGVYNRRYFQQEVIKLYEEQIPQVGVVICDVDGLKFINDTLGHAAGDTVLTAFADILKNSFLEVEHMVARIGGDEFVVLTYGIYETKIEAICNRIRNELNERNLVDSEFKINASIGYALRGDPCRKVEDVLKEADDKMYREKLFHAESTRSAIVQTLEKALETRDFVTEGHADRLQDLISELAIKIGYSKSRVADLRLFGKFHDIGKVGTPDRILFKKGQLNPGERAEMRRHSEMGYKIAQSSPDLLPIADWILKHHENWNGTGYPLGLKGNQIPLECRMLSIVDAYDAMTNDRPYRKAMTHEAAIAELQRCSGTQFDPELVESFIGEVDLVEDNEVI